MVGTWVVAQDGPDKVIMVDGRPWVASKDNPTRLLDRRSGQPEDNHRRRSRLDWTLGSEPGPGRNNAPPNPDLFPANNPVLRPPVSGKVGLWAKTDSTSYFKECVVVTK